MRLDLIKELEEYRGESEEMEFSTRIISLIETEANCFYRSIFSPGHITGSALLLNRTGDKVLLNHHKFLDKWLAFGGHADGSEDIRDVALRETIEESGFQEIEFATPEIFDIDIHPIPENPKKGEPAHEHFDILFLLRLKTESENNFVVSDESNSLKWCTPDEAKILLGNSRDMNRLVQKWTSGKWR